MGDDTDVALLTRLRAGDEAAFRDLVDQYHAPCLRVARVYVRSRADAEEVVQDAWLGVIKGLDGFEGRSSLKTWIMRIVANRARSRAVREARSVPFSDLSGEGDEGIDADRFRSEGDAFPGHWTSYPRQWPALPDDAAAMGETLGVLRHALESLPAMQRMVFTLRDVEGWDAADTVNALELTEANQRVLLHRARTKLRAALERHFGDE